MGMEKHAFIKACLKILNTEELTDEMLANRAMRLLHTGKLVDYDGNVYRTQTAKAEIHLSDAIIRQSISSHGGQYADLEAELDGEEAILKLRLAPEQRDAVKMALTSGLSIVTGGPGTGKTLIQRAILDIYRKNHPNAEICCCAPTGRAARRMAQSTGYPASTVHKALGLIARDDGSYGRPTDLDADLILVDEVSMLDVYLAGRLFDALKYGAQLVLIGDADQLPSVGPGAVLSEMIASGCIPVVRLDITGCPEEAKIQQAQKRVVADLQLQQKKLLEQIEKDTKQLETLRAEIAKAIAGESFYTQEDLATAIRTIRDRIAEAQSDVEKLKQEETHKKMVSATIIPAYKQFRSWSVEFEEAPLEIKKTIATQLFSRVTVNKDYELTYEMNFTYRQFCEDWLSQTPVFSQKAVT